MNQSNETDRKAQTASDWLAILCEHFQVDLSDTALAVWLATLCELPEADIGRACQWAIRHKPKHPSWFPAPQQAIDAVRGDGSRDWVVLLQALTRLDPSERFERDRLSPQGREALDTIGGAYALRQLPIDRVVALKPQFLEAWQIFARDASLLSDRALQPQPEIPSPPPTKIPELSPDRKRELYNLLKTATKQHSLSQHLLSPKSPISV